MYILGLEAYQVWPWSCLGVAVCHPARGEPRGGRIDQARRAVQGLHLPWIVDLHGISIYGKHNWTIKFMGVGPGPPWRIPRRGRGWRGREAEIKAWARRRDILGEKSLRLHLTKSNDRLDMYGGYASLYNSLQATRWRCFLLHSCNKISL
jgi:hypothetical protein